MLTILAFIVTLGILITVHEYGHFQVARLCGVKVLRFSIGFGKPLFSRRLGKDQTEFVLATFPLGGYVKMLDEREASPESPVPSADLPRAFNRQSVWKRILIVSAGPAANLLLAIFLYWLLFMHGVTGMKPLLGEIPPNTPAAQASLKYGEQIRKIAGVPVATWQDVRWILLQQALESPVVEVEAVSGNREVHLHQLDLSGIGKEDFEGDFLSLLGLVPYQPAVPARIGEIIAGGAAEQAGLKPGDEILLIDGIAAGQWEDFVRIVRKRPDQQLSLKIRRGDEELYLPITPQSATENGENIGRVGAAYRMDQAEIDKILTTVEYAPAAAFIKAAQKTWDTSIFSLRMLGNMLTGDVSWKGISGPVTIASYAGQSAQIGLGAFLSFLALVSISLGVLNLLPVPVLDGGHLLYYVVEIFKGSPVSERMMEVGQRIGLILLGLLMAIAFYNDFHRFITG
jgi:regulator of sigma E protease